MCWIIRDLYPVVSRVQNHLQNFHTFCRFHKDPYLTGTGLCLELNRTDVGRAVNRYGLCLELNRAGVGRAVKRYGLVWN